MQFKMPPAAEPTLFGLSSPDVLGATLAVLAAVVSASGTAIQKRSHRADALLPPDEKVPYYYRRLWWLGLIAVVGGAVGDFCALGFASQALVAALGGPATLITNVWLSHYLGQEPLFVTDMAGFACVVLGSLVLASTLGPGESFSLTQLQSLFASPNFVGYLLGQVLVIVLLLATIVDSVAYKWRASITAGLMAPIYYRLDDLQDVNDRLLLRVRRLETRLRALSRHSSRSDVQHADQPSSSQQTNYGAITNTDGRLTQEALHQSWGYDGGQHRRNSSMEEQLSVCYTVVGWGVYYGVVWMCITLRSCSALRCVLRCYYCAVLLCYIVLRCYFSVVLLGNVAQH